MINSDIGDDMSNISKGKYEIFEVGDKMVLSDSREKIKEYAKERNIDEIAYRMSVESVEGLEVDKKI